MAARTEPTGASPLEAGRSAFARSAWTETAAELQAADAAAPLGIDDLERLATALHMLGRPLDANPAWERAHHAALAAGEPARAARFAFHLVMSFGQRGEHAQAGGWHARGMRILDEAGTDCVERALLSVPLALLARDERRYEDSLAMFDELAVAAARFHDPDVLAMSCLGRGETLIALGQVDRGIALLDEAMVAVTTGDVTPINVGIVYCGSIEGYQTAFDLGRAREWTAALDRWTASQPDALPFRGRCLVFRSEIRQLRGDWTAAAREADQAHDWLSRPPPDRAVGEACYQQAEIHRLRGDVAAADAAFREASRWGKTPDPGLALLRLDQGKVEAAVASIDRALQEADLATRPRLLGPAVEIRLAAGDVAGAQAAADELRGLAGKGPPKPLLRAITARADGLVRLAEGDVAGALGLLRTACQVWQSLEAPYDAARARVAVARACGALGDEEAARLELGAARSVFVELGARAALAEVDALLATEPAAPGGLSPRELEVLAHLAAGSTNRQIGAALGISERTVDRHVSNLYTKLDVSSRAAATAFAIEHRLA
ncbi:MAG TPA: response regulator transcription factor [Candidatus Limnocylindrales bacterium]|nr:response regulator transcription factor [Candidatus Limnocylindrales bacterium]